MPNFKEKCLPQNCLRQGKIPKSAYLKYFQTQLKSAYIQILHCSRLPSSRVYCISKQGLHCNPLQGNYRVELLHREIPVVITGNEFTEYSFLLFWLHFFPCFNNIEIVALVPVICTGNCQFILQGLKGCFNTL